MEQEIQKKNWGRFQLVSLLGSGGVGNVYKAYDPNLKRHVALKILRTEAPEVVERFLREARAQAQVEHSHVCKIYESGEIDGHPFIAMQYVDGQNLRELNDRLGFEEKIRIMKDVALGIHAAHCQGMIHRDVKPANVMVQQTEDGQWKPYVMDFGLAREQAAPGLTSTGMVIGTPFYMSPEHAKGKLKDLDRRSDIYSLGVTLYELLGGDVPFNGNTPVDILMQIIEKDPQPLRKINPRIPMDIETIVMKCMEKDPNRRYGSARELAEDLQRYLNGDPIKARPATITYRFKRKLTKHKWPALGIAIASAVIIILTGLWLQTKWTASQRAVIAQQLGQEVEKIESTIRYAHLLNLHDISQEKEIIRQRIAKIGQRIKEVGKMALGPGHYAMGRGFMALQEYDNAAGHLEKAWNSGYRTPGVAYDLGRAMGELYLKESEKATRIESKEMREARTKEIEKMFREPAVNYLHQAGQIQDESKEYIVALIAFYEKKYNRALDVLQTAMQKARQEGPWVYTAKILEGNIYLAIGKEKSNYEQAADDFSRAEEAYREVIEIGKSDIRGYIGLTRVLERRIMIRLHTRGGDLQPLVDKAIDYCHKALRIEPGRADIHVTQSSVYRWLCRYRIFTGQDPLPSFKQSIAAAEKAISIQPENFDAYTIVGNIKRYEGEYRMDHGEDPTPIYRTAIDSFAKAIEINPNHVMAYNGIGNVYVRIAQYEMNQGKDPHASLEQAIAKFEKALSINPGLVDIHNGLAGALWFQGGGLMARGQDPRPSFLKAAQSLKNAIQITPNIAYLYTNLGFVYMDIGRYEVDYGHPPGESVKQAVDYFEKAVKINPRGNELYLGLVSVSVIRTKYDYMMGKDCAPRVNRAHEYFKRGLEVNPNLPTLYTRMVENFVLQARQQLDGGHSPLSTLDRADRLLKKARTINPKSHEIHVQQGEISLLKACWALTQQENPEPYFNQAQASLRQAETLNPGYIYLHLTGARLQRRRAEWKISRGQPAQQDINSGLTAIEKALKINASYGEAYMLKGVLLTLGAAQRSSSSQRQAAEKEARDAFSRGTAINKNLKILFASIPQYSN